MSKKHQSPKTPPLTPQQREEEATRRLSAVINAILAELGVDVTATLMPLTDVPGGFRPVIHVATRGEK